MRQDAIQQNNHDGNEDGVQSEGGDRLGNNILGQLDNVGFFFVKGGKFETNEMHSWIIEH